MAKRVLSEEEATEINLSPMIDCIFILLIFFIVTTVFVEEKGLQVHKPDAAAATPQTDENLNLSFEIRADNKVYESGAEVSLAEVTAKVRGVANDPDIPIVIRAHEKSDHGVFVSVWDAARQGGPNTMSFSTTN